MNLLDQSLLARSIAHLSRHAFTAFITELFSEDNKYYGFHALPTAGEDVFYQPLLDSYGGSIHSVLLLHFPPLELFQPSQSLTMHDPTLIERLARVRNIYYGEIEQWGMISPFLKKDAALNSIKFITNLFGVERQTYQDMLIPAYQRLKRFCGLKKPWLYVGSCDSFVDLNCDGAQQAFKNVVNNYTEGIAVSISEHDVSVQDFTVERSIASGISAGTRSAYEPILVRDAIRQRAPLCEFKKLIEEDAFEGKLEQFLSVHYRDVFGAKYDRIETQLWLRFPEHDIRNKDRRLDLFLRNSLKNDWELFEIKRPISLTSTYRDVPVIVSEVSNAIHQIRNYGRVLRQDRVKEHFAAEGIEYYEPVLNLVIGRTPQIPHDQWRWLETENAERVRIFTFDDLLGEMRCRLEDHYNILEQLLRFDVR